MGKGNKNPKKITKQIVVLYHGDCSDGLGGAWAAWKKFGSKADYVALYRGNPVPEGLSGRTLYFIDFVYESEIVSDLVANNKKVVGLDHHVTMKVPIALMDKESVYSEDHSGAVVAWKYFHRGKKVPLLLRYIEDRDTWRWKMAKSREFSAYIEIQDLDFKNFNKLAKDFESASNRKRYLEIGNILLKERRDSINRLVSSAELVDFEGQKVFAVNAPHVFAGDLGNVLAKMHPPFAIVWVVDGSLLRVSLRGLKGSNVGELSRKYGGGGHEAAAGFTLPFKADFPWKRNVNG